jgi:DNA invertase Pin-like site-specific DNA recombinase
MDESGGTQDRPGLREAIRWIENGETEGIACWQLNRFATTSPVRSQTKQQIALSQRQLE